MMVMVLVFITGLAGLAVAAKKGEKGSREEAKAMVVKAVALVKSAGKAKAFAAFNDKNGAFIDRDLYIYASDMSGKILCHGTNPALIGKDFFNLKDADGKYFIQEIIAQAKTKGSGWMDYKWTHPISKKIENKSAYFQKVDDVIIICGVYK